MRRRGLSRGKYWAKPCTYLPLLKTLPLDLANPDLHDTHQGQPSTTYLTMLDMNQDATATSQNASTTSSPNDHCRTSSSAHAWTNPAQHSTDPNPLPGPSLLARSHQAASPYRTQTSDPGAAQTGACTSMPVRTPMPNDRPRSNPPVNARPSTLFWWCHLGDVSSFAQEVKPWRQQSVEHPLCCGPALSPDRFPAQRLAPKTLTRAETLPHRPSTQWRARRLVRRLYGPRPPWARPRL
jgi:hypothetical protein